VYLHCGKCGKRVYGRENVDALLKDQRRAWEGDEELQAEIRRRKAEEARKKLEEARAERLQAEHQKSGVLRKSSARPRKPANRKRHTSGGSPSRRRRLA